MLGALLERQMGTLLQRVLLMGHGCRVGNDNVDNNNNGSRQGNERGSGLGKWKAFRPLLVLAH